MVSISSFLWQNELRQNLALKVKQLEAKNVQLEVKIGKLEAKVEQQDSLLTSLLREKNERTAAAANVSVPISNNQSAVAIPGLPSSCADLKMIGHTLSGFYSVLGSAKMESLYCDFTKLPTDPGKCLDSYQIFRCNYCLFFNSIINVKVSRNGSDTSTSNRCPSISTYREIFHLTHNQLQFRSSWRCWTRETPWIWHRGNSRHRCREFIFSLSQELRIFFLHLRLRLILIFIWTGI